MVFSSSYQRIFATFNKQLFEEQTVYILSTCTSIVQK